ncbi:alpha/beta-hydrolase [Trametes punicea]|nr:alpha/beta-hydrolase [Trametes punicea]KAI8992879.1 alpha/beta-hydrolase [Trametes punicea]
MDLADGKQSHHYLPPLDRPTDTQCKRTRLSRRVKTVVVLIAFSVAVGLNLCRGVSHVRSMDNLQAFVEEPEFDWYALEPARSIQWTSCYSGQKCARLLLPLDYGTPDGPTTAIALRMIPSADKEHYKGTILINPGGPGGSGTDLVARAGRNISRVVGESFDILGFDPRGTGASTPSASCFETDSQRKLWYLQEGHHLLNITDDSLEIQRARENAVARRCEDKIGGEWGIGRFMSTPDVARDMLEIVHQLGQEKLQYWGFSYGSILGQYFSAIYPDKVGRVIIDGVYDAHNYRAALWNSNLIDVDTVIDSFFHFCHQAGPGNCTLFESSPEKIRTRYFDLLHALEKEPLAVPLAEPPFLITRKVLQRQLFGAAYKPLAQFGIVADTVRAIEQRNQTALIALAPKIVDPTECRCTIPEPWRSDNEAFNAIACGDGDEHPYDAETYAKYYQELAADSELVAPFWGVHYLQCSEWRIRPKWRWTGPLEAKNTSHPILLLSPRYDPVCPLRDAKAVQERYGGSGLLVQDSYGHCSLSAPSLCTAKHVRAYMVNGTLPEPGTVCEADELPFVGSVKDVRAMSAEDAELLDALRGLSEVVPMFGAV